MTTLMLLALEKYTQKGVLGLTLEFNSIPFHSFFPPNFQTSPLRSSSVFSLRFQRLPPKTGTLDPLGRNGPDRVPVRGLFQRPHNLRQMVGYN